VLLDVLHDALRTAVSTETAVFALLAISLNLQYGYTGLLNFGEVGYLMIGSWRQITVAVLGGGLDRRRRRGRGLSRAVAADRRADPAAARRLFRHHLARHRRDHAPRRAPRWLER
jgi:hypothetical protein